MNPAYAVCFCDNGDPLSQWRGYGVDGGYALGFDRERLRAAEPFNEYDGDVFTKPGRSNVAG